VEIRNAILAATAREKCKYDWAKYRKSVAR